MKHFNTAVKNLITSLESGKPVKQTLKKYYSDAAKVRVKAKNPTLEQIKVKDITEAKKIQCQKGNYDFDPYQHGLANGLILAEAIMKEKDPKYIEVEKYTAPTEEELEGLTDTEKEADANAAEGRKGLLSSLFKR